MTQIDQLGLFATAAPLAAKAPELTASMEVRVAFRRRPKKEHADHLLMAIKASLRDCEEEATVTTSVDEQRPWFDEPFFALDVETTGLDPALDRVIELALIPFNMPSLDTGFAELFGISEEVSAEITNLTGITNDMLKGKPPFPTKLAEIKNLLKRASFVVAYNAKFDRPFVESEFARAGEVLPNIDWVDPFMFICEIDRFKRGKKLTDAAERWGVSLTNAHRAAGDAKAAGDLMLKLKDKIDATSLEDLLKAQTIFQWNHTRSMAQYKKNSSWSVNR